MKRVIDIQGGYVLVADEFNRIETLPAWAFRFAPCLGDYVEIYRGAGFLVVHKAGIFDSRYYIRESDNNVQHIVYTKGRKVNRDLYIILSLFFGTIGLQKMYSGRLTQGILCMIFSFTGIPSLIGIRDTIRAMSRKADNNGNIII